MSISLDPVTFKVIQSGLSSLVEEMGVRLTRVAFSPVIVEGKDFSLGLTAPNGDLVSTGPRDLPAFIGTMEFTVRAVLERYPMDEIHPGDIFMLNDPHRAGTHNNDLRVVYPVFIEGELLTWIFSCGHWADVGGPEPGSFNANATSVFAEGVLVPVVKLYSAGVRNEALIDLFMANLRQPRQSRGDLQAMLHACWAGETRLNEIVDRYGINAVRQAMSDMIDYSEALLAAKLADLPNGVFEFEDYCDTDAPHPDSPPIKVHLRLTIEDGHLTFDYRGSGDQPVGPMGSGLPMCWSATTNAVLNLFPGVPPNHGVFRRITILTRPGSSVHVEYPGAISGTAAGVYEKITACVLNVFGQADSALKSGAIYNLTNISIGGDDDAGRPWLMYLWMGGGYGGTVRGDAGLPTMMLMATATKTQPVELLERTNPILFESSSMIIDSMGAGRHRGGPGQERTFRILTEGTSAFLTAIGDRNVFPIWGVDGGAAGHFQDVVVDVGGPSERSVGCNVSGVRVSPGGVVRCWTGGGGGLGNPLEREPDAVLEDVRQGYVSIAGAERDYGVLIHCADEVMNSYDIDRDRTTLLRQERLGRTANPVLVS